MLALEAPLNRRLLRWLDPAPGENLPSFLFRLAQANFYDPPALLQWLWRERLRAKTIRSDSMAYPAQPESYRILQDLSGLPYAQLYLLSGHWLARTMTPPDIPLPELHLPDGQIVPLLSPSLAGHWLYPVRAAPYCPLCLAEARVYPLAWLTDLAICLRHQVLLCDACPACQAPLALPAILTGYCPHCDADLCATIPPSVCEDSSGLLAQQQLAAWLGLLDPALPLPGLPVSDPRLLYALFQGFHRCLRRRLLPQFVHRPPALAHLPLLKIGPGRMAPSGLNYMLTTTALSALSHWPDGFSAFLDAYRAPAPYSHVPNLRRQLGSLYQFYLQERWQHPALHFVQTAFDDYFLHHFANSLALRRCQRFHRSDYLQQQSLHWIDLPMATELLGDSPGNILFLIRRGILTLVQRQPVMKVERQQVLALKHFRETHIQMHQAARELGLSAYLVKQLILLGLLSRQTFPGYREEYWWLRRDEVQTLRQRLERVLRPHPQTQTLKTLTQAMYRLSFHHLKGGQVLLAILEARLPAYRLDGPTRLDLMIRVAPDDLNTFCASL